MKKWMIIPALAGVVAIGGVAMANDTPAGKVSTTEGLMTLQEAKDLALQQYGGKVTEIELEKKKSGYVYDVEVKSNGVEYDLDIDAKTGSIKLESQSTDKPISENTQKTTTTNALKVVEPAQPRVADAKLLTADQAIAIAKKKANGTVSRVELDSDDGRKHYDIEIKDGTYEYEFEIDAYTGKILEFEKDRDDDNNVNKQATAVKTETVTQSNKVAGTKQALLTKDQAIAIAKKKANGTVTKFELDSDDGRKRYDIEIKGGTYEYDFEIDAFTGEILKFEKDRDDDAKTVNKQVTAVKAQPVNQTNKVESTKKAMLTKDQAIAIAMKQAKGTVTDFELDDDDDRKVYEIEIEDGTYEYEFKIDAFTGEILEFEKDRDDD